MLKGGKKIPLELAAPWIWKSARNKSTSLFRKREREIVSDWIEDRPANFESVRELYCEAFSGIVEWVSKHPRLTDRQKTVFMARYIARKSVIEIARQQNVSAPTVYRQLQRVYDQVARGLPDAI